MNRIAAHAATTLRRACGAAVLCAAIAASMVVAPAPQPASAAPTIKIFFSAVDGEHGRELWRSDGTADGTRLVRDIKPGTGSSLPFAQYTAVPITQLGKRVIFAADDGVHGTELWRSDGTRSGTRMIKDVRSGAGDGASAYQVGPRIGRFVYFTGRNSKGHELWRTDGTAAGTRMVSDGIRGAEGSYPSGMVAMGGILYFSAIHARHGLELWRSNGTAAGTHIVKNISDGVGGNGLHHDTLTRNSAALDGNLYFQGHMAEDGGDEPWKTDGTTRGTRMVKNIREYNASGGFGAGSEPDQFTRVGDYVYFRANSDSEIDGHELWRTKGTERSTVKVFDEGPEQDHRMSLGSAMGRLFFSSSKDGHALWRTDGNRASNIRVRDFVDAPPRELTGVDGLLYFAGDGMLWRSDGTAAGTTSLGAPQPEDITDAAGATFFFTAAGEDHRELWRSNGTRAGTSLVRATNTGGPRSPDGLTRVDF